MPHTEEILKRVAEYRETLDAMMDLFSAGAEGKELLDKRDICVHGLTVALERVLTMQSIPDELRLEYVVKQIAHEIVYAEGIHERILGQKISGEGAEKEEKIN